MASSNMSLLSSCLLHLNWMSRTTNTLHADTTYFLACIHTCYVDKRNSLGVLIYLKMGASEVVDLDQLKCLVGSVQNGGYTAIIDHTGECMHEMMEFLIHLDLSMLLEGSLTWTGTSYSF